MSGVAGGTMGVFGGLRRVACAAGLTVGVWCGVLGGVAFGQAGAMGQAGSGAGSGGGSGGGSGVVAIRAGAVYPVSGGVIEDGVVVVTDGRISAVGGSGTRIPAGATVIEMPGGSVMPGMVDANARLESADAFAEFRARPDLTLRGVLRRLHGGEAAFACLCTGFSMCPNSENHPPLTSETETCPLCAFPSHVPAEFMASGLVGSPTVTESSSEVVPHTRVIDSVNLASRDLDRLAAGGVTTAYVSPDTSAVIGPRGAIVRTGGPVAGRVVRAEDAVHAAIGSDPFRAGPGNTPPFGGFVSTRTRRPTTRMGVEWVFRKAMHDTRLWARGEAVSGGADTPGVEAMGVLERVLDGEVGLRVHARMMHDMTTAQRLSEEFGGLRFTLLEATEAYQHAGSLAANGTSVVFGPIYEEPSGLRRFTPETQENRVTTLAALLRAGVRTALSAQDLRDEDGLARQAMYAMRAGLSLDEAMRAVTLTPAEIIGVAQEAGSLEAGKRGDVVVWTGEPFAATSRVAAVLIGGELVYDGR